MTQEEKQLLLKDLCARLPYGVKVRYPGGVIEALWSITDGLAINDDNFLYGTIKPYLRPMLSMTEEERGEFRTLILPEVSCAYEDCLEWDAEIIGGGCLQISVEDFSTVTDWLNAHHFDYRGLIEKELALEAPDDMYTQK